jgi:Na+/H+ antiporter NhaA
VSLYEAGVHPTIAGVAMGLLAPVTPRIAPELVDIDELTDLGSVEQAQRTSELARSSVSTVEWLEYVLHPWSSFVIVPIFALANAGVVVSTASLRAAWGSPITWGILIGLVVGKPLGVLLATRLAVRSGTTDRPEGTTNRQLIGVGNAAGIGFTVALFVAELAFTDDRGVVNPRQLTDAKMAILVGSVISGVLAYIVLRQRGRPPTKLS